MVLASTGGKPEGLREATYELAKKLRENMAVKFSNYRGNSFWSSDEREFPRMCMDELLVEA